MTNLEALPHRLDRALDIQADPQVVFRFFTDPVRWAAWWGAGSTIEARVGGRVLIRYPDGTEASGEVVELAPPERLVFTYGYAKGSPIPPGTSLVSLRLEPRGQATRVLLSHAFADPAVRDEHVQGWRFQLSLFANVVADEAFAGSAERVDRWFAAWSEDDAREAEKALRAVAATGVRMRDRFSALEGIEEVLLHMAAGRRFMPGLRMQREGPVRQCQGMALADWVARTADGQERASGTNLFVFDGGGRIESVTGFWNAGR